MIDALNTTLALTRLAELTPMHQRQRVVAIAGSVTVVLVVFELVRRRKLRSSYIVVTIQLVDLVTGELVFLDNYEMKTESEKSVINR